MSWDPRLSWQIGQLRRQFPVEHDSKAGVVVIEVKFPDGWTPTQGPLRFDIPSDYPVEPPRAHVIEEMEAEYDGSDRLFQPIPESNWKLVDWYVAPWDESQHTLMTATNLVLGALEGPVQVEV